MRRSRAAVTAAISLAILTVLSGCGQPSRTVQADPAGAPATPGGSPGGPDPGTPALTGSGAATTPAGVRPPGGTGAASTGPRPTTPPPTSAKPAGGISFDPFAATQCTWVPRMFVDLSGRAKPGVRVQVPVWVTGLTTAVSLTVRGSLTDASGYQTTATITAEPPEWRGQAVLAMAGPAGDTFGVDIELDTGHNLSASAIHHGVRATLPVPRPTSDQSVPCPVVV